MFKNLNPTAVALWAFTACMGYLVNPTLYGAIAGLAVGLGLTVVVSVVAK